MGTCFATRAAAVWERLLARVGVGAAGKAGPRLAGPAGWRGGPQEGERGRPAAAPVGPSRPCARERARSRGQVGLVRLGWTDQANMAFTFLSHFLYSFPFHILLD